MPIYDEPEYTKIDPYEADLRITNFNNLRPEDQDFFNQLAAGSGMSSGQAYLDSRNGYYPTSTYYGDVPEWQRTASGSGSLAGKIALMADALTKGTDTSLPPNLAKAVASGYLTAQQAASYYWNNGLTDIRYRDYLGLQQGVPIAGLTTANADGSGGSWVNGTFMPSGSGANSFSGNPLAGLTNEQQNAIAILQKTFESYGLGSLSGAIIDMVKQGYAADTVSLLLQDTPEYKQRFAANEARRKAGMAVLSPAEYLATERAYRQIMNAAGLPSGFYDQQEDFTALLSKDISPAELNARVQTAAEAVLNADPFYTQSLRDLYGMTNGDMIAFVLDANRSLPLIQQRANAVAFGAAAQRQGIDNIGVDTAEQYAGLGVGKAQSEQGFAQIATMLPRTEQLGQIYGSDYGQSDALSEVFNNDVQAAQKRRKLVQSETDTFTGSSGVRAGSLASSKQGLI